MSCVKPHTATSFPLCSSTLTNRYSTRHKPGGSRELRITGILGSWYAAGSARTEGSFRRGWTSPRRFADIRPDPVIVRGDTPPNPPRSPYVVRYPDSSHPETEHPNGRIVGRARKKVLCVFDPRGKAIGGEVGRGGA
jgi:hypothetical protein